MRASAQIQLEPLSLESVEHLSQTRSALASNAESFFVSASPLPWPQTQPDAFSCAAAALGSAGFLCSRVWTSDV